MTEADAFCENIIEQLGKPESIMPGRRAASKETTESVIAGLTRVIEATVVDSVVNGAGDLMMRDEPDEVCRWIRACGKNLPEDYKVLIEAEEITVTIREYVERHTALEHYND